MRFDKKYKIISNKNIVSNYFELTISAANTAQKCSPGQFFMISVPEVFLSRPLSIHNIKGNNISFLYKVIGKGTNLLSAIKTGDIRALGPLGKGYPIYKKDFPILVAGGSGIASLFFLAKSFNKKGILFYGAKSKKDLVSLDAFKKLGWKIYVSTEDGSYGNKGFITDTLINNLKNIDEKKIVYICGPQAMLKKIVSFCNGEKLKAFVSYEEHMACGLGICQGCALKIKSGMKTVCKDGPVFAIEEIL
jgi:dihydroorotate dehydrogenase electron transfer subunit